MVRASPIKKAAIVRAGYEYQDLVGVEVLIRHFRDPTLYAWVKLEADDPQIQSLDDVIALRQDGSVEYAQVKFTVDPEQYELDWPWLLAKKKKGTSLLGKWARAFGRARSYGRIASAQLLTNRRPSADFASCLDGPFVDLDRINPELRREVERECAGAANARTFFAHFAFPPPLLDLEGFEQSLRDTVINSDTDERGWLRFRDEVRRWATFKDRPPPEGKISREHVAQLITRNRPQPIRQDFLVPDGYMPPSAKFDDELRERASNPNSPISIVWGSPGRGKSTYLSHLTQGLKKSGNVVIRHHYFLPNDQAGNRTSFFEIANSLLHQLASQDPTLVAGEDEPHDLRRALTRAANELRKRDAKLYLVIDGLDHVWRDTERVDQLDHLFNTLLPLPPNVVLLIGTQRVPDAQLPNRLLSMATTADWVEIPRMDEAAVHHWLRHQDEVRPFILAFEHNDRTEQLDAIAAVLFKVSGGHPLHLIYSLESLRLLGEPISPDSVALLPPCPEGDIRAYYQRLWVGLTNSARDILHGLAGSEFYWPGIGVRNCFGDYHEIAFLLEPRARGLTPFHPSIFAWVRERPDHAERYLALLPKIVAWLDQAPPYWRWGWRWVVNAQAGNVGPLLTHCTRDWAVGSLAEGWPETQIDKIIAAAERHAFTAFDLPKTLAMRALRGRVADAHEFQARNFGLFQAVALTSHANHQQIANLIDDPVELDDDELAQLTKYCPGHIRGEVVSSALEELWRRLHAWITLRHKPSQDFDKLSNAFLSCTGHGGLRALPRALRFISGYRDPHPHYDRLIVTLGNAGDTETLREIRHALRGATYRNARRRAQEEMLRSAWRKGADPAQQLGRTRILAPLATARAALRGPGGKIRADVPAVPSNLTERRYRGEPNGRLEEFFCDYFWLRLAGIRTGDAALRTAYDHLDIEGLGWISTGLGVLDEAAHGIAEGTLPLAFSTPFIAAANLVPVPFSNSREQEFLQYISFRKSLVQLATDLQLMGGESSREWRIPASEFEIARASLHWVDEVWLEDNSANAIPYLSGDAAAHFLNSLASDLAAKVNEFSERAEQWTQLAALALLYQLPEASGWIRRAADCLIGYGHRKDLTAMEVLDAIEAVHAADPSHSERWVRSLVPVIDEITAFTDGDETDHVRSDLVDIVALTMPKQLPALFQHHHAADEFRYADECLQAAIKFLEFGSPQSRALAHTIIDPLLLYELDRRAENDPKARALREQQLEFLGGEPLAKADRDYSTPDPPERKPKRKINPARYPPAKLAALISDMNAADVSYKRKPELLRQWLDHWLSRGRAVDALNALDLYLQSNDSGLEVEEVLDHAFQVSLTAQGKGAAYGWLVRAHIHRNGWSRFWAGNEEVLNRLSTAATHYADRWRNYVLDTSEQSQWRRRRGLWFAIGRQYLVRYLLLVGQVQPAIQVTDTLVQIFLAEVGDQPIGDAKWFA